MCVRKLATCLVVLVVALGRRGAAQGGNIPIEETTPLTMSGFAVGLGSYDRNLAQNTALGSKLALSVFRPWSDQLYFFGQLTTHLEQADSGPPETAIEIDNLIINWTPKRLSTLTLSFGRFDAPLGFERDDEPLNLIPTTSFTFENAIVTAQATPWGPKLNCRASSQASGISHSQKQNRLSHVGVHVSPAPLKEFVSTMA